MISDLEQSRAAFEQAAIGIAIADFEGYVLQANQMCVELLGYTAEELGKTTFLNITHPEDVPKTRQLLDELLKGQRNEYSLEKRYIRKDGSTIWCKITVTLLRASDGTPHRLVGILEDVSIRKKNEEAYIKSENLSRTIIESSKDCFKILSLDGILIWISNTGLKSLQINDESKILNKPWVCFWNEKDQKFAKKAVEDAATGAIGVFVGSFPVGGSERWWEVVITPILDLNGHPEKLLAVSRDITSKIQDEVKLKEESHILGILNRTGRAIASQLDLQELLQNVTDAATEISGAEFGAFFYNSIDENGEQFLLYTLSGAPRAAFESFSHPRATPLFDPTFRGEGIIRLDDIMSDPRYGKMSPYFGMPKGHLPVRSYLAVPVKSRTEEVIGGLFFGHSSVGKFSEKTEDIVKGIAAQSGVAIDNARLYEAAQREISYRKSADRILKETQRELLIHQARLESIIMFSEDAIVTKSLHGIIQSWNPAAERIFGYTEKEAIGSSIHIIIPPELQKEEETILAKISKGERVEHLETTRLAKDGRRLIISVTSSPIKDPDGKIVGATKIARDVTEQRQRAAAIEESEARFRDLAEERRDLLTRESKARKEVEEANRIKDQFLATLSHELRTPLNAILGWTQLATRNPNDGERAQEALKIIERNAKSQAQIIADLLDMNRIVSGALRLDLQNIDLLQIVDEAIETVTPSAEFRKVRIKKSYRCEACPVFADPNRTKQIVWNLLTNAVKFSNRDETIYVSLERVVNTARLTVVDTGEGIGEDFLPFVFDRFSQADTSSARQFGGLGLGLSIVRQLVELHGGTIKAESAGKGRGASFTVTLPISISKSPIVKLREEVFIDSLNKLRVLVVDDEADARNLIKELLLDWGAEVTGVDNSESALNLYNHKPFDLIISDIGMPGGDGYQFIRKVRESKKEKTTPAIALTAYARAEDRKKALEAGFQMHMSKPIEPSELLAVIRSLTSPQ